MERPRIPPGVDIALNVLWACAVIAFATASWDLAIVSTGFAGIIHALGAVYSLLEYQA